MSIKLILILVLTAFVVVFITQNVAPVEVAFLFWSISLSRALLIFFILMIGIIIGWFLHSYYGYRQTKDDETGVSK